MLYRIVEVAKIEVVVEVEFMWRLRQINAVPDFKVAVHSSLTFNYYQRKFSNQIN